jgi:hypothetical protein
MTSRRRATRLSGGTPRVFRTASRDAIDIRRTPTGDVGLLYSGEGIEAVWVSKGAERIDRGWFQYPRIDVIAVLKGRLKVEFRGKTALPRVLRPGDVLVLPPRTACRAYRWPRNAARPTVFLAVYRNAEARRDPGEGEGRRTGRSRGHGG